VIAGGASGKPRAVVVTRARPPSARPAEPPKRLPKTGSQPISHRAIEPDEPDELEAREPAPPKTEFPRFLVYAGLALAIAGALYILLVRRR
jgi:hypothetical protein